MNDKGDISRLFGRFGADPSEYQDIVHEQDLEESAARWPFLAQHRYVVGPDADVHQTPAVQGPAADVPVYVTPPLDSSPVDPEPMQPVDAVSTETHDVAAAQHDVLDDQPAAPVLDPGGLSVAPSDQGAADPKEDNVSMEQAPVPSAEVVTIVEDRSAMLPFSHGASDNGVMPPAAPAPASAPSAQTLSALFDRLRHPGQSSQPDLAPLKKLNLS